MTNAEHVRRDLIKVRPAAPACPLQSASREHHVDLGFTPFRQSPPPYPFVSATDFVRTGFRDRGLARLKYFEGKLTIRTRLSRSDRHVATSPELITAIKNLYIVSSAAAQLGGHGLEVREAQWRALAQKTEMARVVLDQQATTHDTDGIAAFHCLAKMCEDVVVLYAMRRPFPATLWREVGRLGREAYECIDLFAPRQRAAGAGISRHPPTTHRQVT